ncbi:glycosyltransferase family 2 protein [Campylobacter avium]|uniref:glycosyltransferase family 2 protein n=1 Tax=Campylobacter avium TaxID=522485 RepID=UPI00255BF545|nr:glycosyltransferase family A protein [Campylobacter avium]
MKPKFSILCPSFNHEKYVGFFIQSVLEQSFDDFELIIVDDFSNDKNVEKIKEFKDERIKLIQHEYNKGINASLNTAFENSMGEFIVLSASDDMFEKDALKIYYESFKADENLLCIYPNLQNIDENNNFIKNDNEQKFGSRAELLHHIFFENNCLNSPGLCMKRTCFEKIHPLPNALCNLQDMAMNINFLIDGKILQLKERLFFYRKSTDKKSISSNQKAKTREKLELELVLDNFLKLKDINLIEQIFKKELEQSKIKPKEYNLDFLLGMLALKSNDLNRQFWGYHKMLNFYNNKENADRLYKDFAFSFKDFLELSTLIKDEPHFKKYKKYKRLFNYSLILSSFLLVLLLLSWSLR